MNGEWKNLFPNSNVNFLLPRVSDHSSSLVCTEYGICGKPKPFKFFDIWVQHKDFLEVVKEGWNIENIGSPLFQVSQ